MGFRRVGAASNPTACPCKLSVRSAPLFVWIGVSAALDHACARGAFCRVIGATLWQRGLVGLITEVVIQAAADHREIFFLLQHEGLVPGDEL